jgi:hypothetical protein
MAKSEAVYLLNDYIKADSVLQNLFMPKSLNIYPVIADEPLDGEPSIPYIRYRTVPSQGSNFRIKMDFVTYYIGDKNYAKAGKIMQRLWEICNMDDSIKNPLPFVDEKFKISSCMFVSGNAPTGPTQENGVIERGITFAIVYTVLS